MLLEIRVAREAERTGETHPLESGRLVTLGAGAAALVHVERVSAGRRWLVARRAVRIRPVVNRVARDARFRAFGRGAVVTARARHLRMKIVIERQRSFADRARGAHARVHDDRPRFARMRSVFVVMTREAGSSGAWIVVARLALGATRYRERRVHAVRSVARAASEALVTLMAECIDSGDERNVHVTARAIDVRVAPSAQGADRTPRVRRVAALAFDEDVGIDVVDGRFGPCANVTLRRCARAKRGTRDVARLGVVADVAAEVMGIVVERTRGSGRDERRAGRAFGDTLVDAQGAMRAARGLSLPARCEGQSQRAERRRESSRGA